MKTIVLDEHYSLENNGQQWKLKYAITYFDRKRDREVTRKNDTFYRSMNQALNAYVDRKLKDCESVNASILMLLNTLNILKQKGFITKEELM